MSSSVCDAGGGLARVRKFAGQASDAVLHLFIIRT
jgi:hypothetical protein